MQSATLRSRVQRSVTSIIAAQFALRVGRVAKRGSVLSSLSPVTSHSAAKLRAVIGTISRSPSAAATGP
jgi:hypothetical protein